MKFYVIEHDSFAWNHSGPTPMLTRAYYVSSGSKDVDPFDIHFAKLFPNIKSVKSALQWASSKPKVYEVDVQVTIGNEVPL